MIVLRVAAFVVGVAIVFDVLLSALRTMVVPRGEQLRLTRVVFGVNRRMFTLVANKRRNVDGRAKVLAEYAPASLMMLAVAWALLIIIGFVPIYWSLGSHSLAESVYLSGSSVTTLGFVRPEGAAENVVAVTEALLGLGIVALLISFLPTIYSLFNRREAEVIKLDVRAGSPPTATEMLIRFWRIGWIDRLDDTWQVWEDWFSLVEESHTSFPALVFFRSQRANSSWVTCAGAVLDSAAISLAVLENEWSPMASITLRSGFMCLRAVARHFGVPFDADPAPNDPISIHREEFDILVDALAAEGLPIKADREQAWRDFAGWRVNYDVPLLALCKVAQAPPTPWSSDRLDGFHRPGLRMRTWRIEPYETPRSW